MTYREDTNRKIMQKIAMIKDNLPHYVQDFLVSKENSKEKSTVLQYGYDLEKFLYFMIDTGKSAAQETANVKLSEINKVRPKDIDEYMNYLTEYARQGRVYHNGEAAKHRKLASLSAFYHYLITNDLVEKDPVVKVEAPKIRQKTIITLDDAQIAKLFKVIRSNHGFKGAALQRHIKAKYRDEAIMMFLLGTGVRISELVGLNLNDIDLDKGMAKVTRKGGNEDIVYFGDDVKESLIRYLEGDKDKEGSRASFEPKGSGKDALFVSRRHNRYAVRSIQTLVEKYARMAFGENNQISPHKMRSTFGTALYKDTGDIELVSKTLGHKNILMAYEKYVKFPEEKKKMAAKRRVIRMDI